MDANDGGFATLIAVAIVESVPVAEPNETE